MKYEVPPRSEVLGADFLRYPRVFAVPHTASEPKNRHGYGSIPVKSSNYYIQLVIDVKVLVKSLNCEVRSCYCMLGTITKVFFRVCEAIFFMRESFPRVGYPGSWLYTYVGPRVRQNFGLVLLRSSLRFCTVKLFMHEEWPFPKQEFGSTTSFHDNDDENNNLIILIMTIKTINIIYIILL